MAGRYRALLIGNSTYPADAHNLQPLKGPARDIAALGRAMTDSATGLFTEDDVTLLADVSAPRALRALGQFFGSATRDDVLLLYFSGHGKLDQGAKLHLCMHDTETTDLLASAVSSTRINEFVEASRARNVVIVLDCCYAGAFRGADLGDSVSGPGRYVLASCRSTQLANDATDDNGTSYFTQHLVDGLTHAADDGDGDGYVSFSDLYAFVDRELRSEGKQIPQRRVDGDGDLRLARRVSTVLDTATNPVPDASSRQEAAQPLTAAAATASTPVAATRLVRGGRARTRALLIGAGIVVVAAAVAAALLLANRPTGAVATSPTSGTYTADGPWRLQLRDTFVGTDPGCTITLTDTASSAAIPLPTQPLYGTIQWQIQRTGTLAWQVSDRNCVVTPQPGTGSISLPALVTAGIGDSDAFAVGRGLSIQVTDFGGNANCQVVLNDATTGTPLDTTRFHEGQTAPVALNPGTAATAYLNPDGCLLRVSPATG